MKITSFLPLRLSNLKCYTVSDFVTSTSCVPDGWDRDSWFFTRRVPGLTITICNKITIRYAWISSSESSKFDSTSQKLASKFGTDTNKRHLFWLVQCHNFLFDNITIILSLFHWLKSKITIRSMWQFLMQFSSAWHYFLIFPIFKQQLPQALSGVNVFCLAMFRIPWAGNPWSINTLHGYLQ